MIVFDFFVFVFGLLAGSFLNCVIYRIEKEESFLKGRSYCPSCKKTLCWTDLIPVISFLILAGRCRYCKKPISLQYPAVEISTAILFLLIFVFNSQFLTFDALYFIFLIIISSFLMIIFVYDLKHYIIPDKVVLPAIVIAIIFGFMRDLSSFAITGLAAATGAAAFFALIVFVSRGRWMGIGDIKLAFLMGLILAWPNILVALFLAFFTGAIVGISLIIANKKTFKSEVPFGPFLIGGTMIALLFGENIINWYLKLLLLG